MTHFFDYVYCRTVALPNCLTTELSSAEVTHCRSDALPKWHGTESPRPAPHRPVIPSQCHSYTISPCHLSHRRPAIRHNTTPHCRPVTPLSYQVTISIIYHYHPGSGTLLALSPHLHHLSPRHNVSLSHRQPVTCPLSPARYRQISVTPSRHPSPSPRYPTPRHLVNRQLLTPTTPLSTQNRIIVFLTQICSFLAQIFGETQIYPFLHKFLEGLKYLLFYPNY